MNSCDSLHGETPLTMAAAAGHKAVVETLLRRGATVTAVNSKGAPPLLGAVREGHWDICVVLLGQGGRLEQPDDSGKTALLVAASEGHVGVLDLLLTKGAVYLYLLTTKQCLEGENRRPQASNCACFRIIVHLFRCLLKKGSKPAELPHA